jgi:hypothetical protein
MTPQSSARYSRVLLIALAVSVTVSGVGGIAAASEKSDTALAKKAVLTLADFPSGWREDTSSTTTIDDQIEKEQALSECRADIARLKAIKASPHADTAQFVNGSASGQYVSNSVTVYKSVKAAKAAMRRSGDDARAQCTQKYVEQNIKGNLLTQGSNVELESVQTGKASVDKLGDEAVGFQTVITMKSSVIPVTLYTDQVSVRQGRSVAGFSFSDTGRPFADKGGFMLAVLGRLSPKGPAGSATTAPTSTTAPNGALAMGTAGKTPRGNTITVHSYEQPATGISSYRSPQGAGNEFAAIDVEACATSGQASTVNSFNFKLQMPDNTRRDVTSGKDPALNFTNLAANDCVRGWVTFEVPAGQRAAYVTYDDSSLSTGGTPLKWTVG